MNQKFRHFLKRSRWAMAAASFALLALAYQNCGQQSRFPGSMVASSVASGQIQNVGGTGNGNGGGQTGPANAGTFVAQSAMMTARYFHTETTLPDGKIFIAGGDNPAHGGSTTEIFDPATGKTTAGPTMSTARSLHTATLLNNGQILFAGGLGSASVLKTAEIYDPTTNTFLAPIQMVTPRSGHTATLLPNGKVWLAGGDTSTTSVSGTNTSELYNPATNTFTASTNLLQPRRMHTATLLPDGTVITEGTGATAVAPTGEIYDGQTQSIIAAPAMASPRYWHTATMMKNGKVLFSGGSGAATAIALGEVYDPVTQVFSSVGNLPTAIFLQTAGLLPDGTVLIMGGVNNGTVFASSEIYNPSTLLYTAGSSMNVARTRAATATLQNGNIVVSGGLGVAPNYTPLTSVDMYVAPPGAGPSGNANAKYSYLAANIFSPVCLRCHGGGAGGVFLDSYAHTLAVVQPGNAMASPLFYETSTGSMPLGGTPLSAALVKDIQDWINDGAPNN